MAERAAEPGTAVDVRDLLGIARRVAEQAADLVRARRADGPGEVGTKTTATDLVTAADRATERLIVDLLRASRPGDLFLGEESGAHSGDRPATAVRWLVDPIDGTVNFVYGLPQYAVSIAAEVNGVVSAGVVRHAVTGEEWTAVAGGGAWRDGRRVAGSIIADLGQALVATGFGYDSRRRAHQAGVVARLLPRVRDIRRLGAASLDLCFAAEGRVDAFFEKGLAAWDLAAGGLIAAEAGLTVTGLRGTPPGPLMVLAAPAGLYDALHELLVELDADGGP
jgi:myo-inositol-1(or 4)-monophosphatase